MKTLIQRYLPRRVLRWALLIGWALGGVTGMAQTNLFHREDDAERRKQMMQQIREQMEAEQAAAAAALAEAEAARVREDRYPQLNELFRYLAAGVLLLTGLMLIANPVAERIPALDPLVDNLLKAAPFLGLAALLVGGLDFGLDLLSYHWVGDTLPVVLLVLGGVTTLRVTRPPPPPPSPSADPAGGDDASRSALHQFAEDTVSKVQQALQRNTRRSLLERLAFPLGILCILAGIAHGIAGETMGI